MFLQGSQVIRQALDGARRQVRNQTVTSTLIRGLATKYNGASVSIPMERRFYHGSPIQNSDAVDIVDENTASDPSIVKSAFRRRLHDERGRSLIGGGLHRIERQHERGKLTARERIELMFDENTFQELDQLKAHRCTEFGMGSKKNHIPGDGIIIGHGRVNGRVVYAFSQVINLRRVQYTLFKLKTSHSHMLTFLFGAPSGFHRFWRVSE